MKIEFILRESTLKDILDCWKASGRTYDSSKGSFTFDNVSGYELKRGVIVLEVESEHFIYNLSDFYRIKVT